MLSTIEMRKNVPTSGSDLLNGSGVAGATIDDALDTLDATKQPLDGMLTGLSGVSATGGFLALSAADTPVARTLQPPAAGLTITNPGGVAGDPAFALANDLAGLEGVTGTGIPCRTGTDAWTNRTLQAGSGKLVWTNPGGVAGNPSIDLGSVAASDLTNGTNGSGAIVLTTGATLVTPTLGVATATSINKMAITAPATGSTLTVADGKTLTASNTLTLAGTDGSTLNVGAGGTLAALAFKASVDCSGSDVTGTLAAARFPALTGDVTNVAGNLATTIGNNVLTYAKFQQVAAVSLVGNPTGSLANAQGITLGSSLTFSGSTINTIQGIRTADTPQFTRLGVGTAATTTEGVKAFTSTTGGAFQNGQYGANTFDSSCTTLGCGMQFAGATQAASFTLATAVCYEAGDWAKGSGSTITTLIGFDAAALTAGGTNNLGFRGQVTTGATGGFNCYMSGTAPNYFAGDVRIGATTAGYKLNVTATSNLFRLGYDGSNRLDVAVTSTGDVTLTAVGTNASLNLATTGSGGVQVNGGSKKLKELTATASLSGFGSIGGNTSATQTISVTGASVGDDVSVTPNGSIGTGLVFSGYVSASDTVTVIVANCTTGSLTPTTRTWRAVVRSF